MDARVEKRIHDAMRRGSERLASFNDGSLRLIKPSKTTVAECGPRAVGALLLQVLDGTTKKENDSNRPISEQDVRAWSRLLDGSGITVVAGKGKERALFLDNDSCSEIIRQILEVRIRTNEWFVLNAFGILSQQDWVLKTASKRTWDAFGFYDIHAMLAEAKEPVCIDYDLFVVMARMAAYITCLIERYSSVEEIAPAKDCLIAIAHGALPIAYNKKTKTIYVGNWHTL